jgi:hypothetical protein
VSGLGGGMNVTGGDDYEQGLFWECVTAKCAFGGRRAG